MIQGLKTLGKWTVATMVILVLGQLIHWGGESISDRIGQTLASAQRSPSWEKVQDAGRSISEDAQEAIRRGTSPKKRANGSRHSPSQEFQDQERNRLRQLIED